MAAGTYASTEETSTVTRMSVVGVTWSTILPCLVSAPPALAFHDGAEGVKPVSRSEPTASHDSLEPVDASSDRVASPSHLHFIRQRSCCPPQIRTKHELDDASSTDQGAVPWSLRWTAPRQPGH